RDRSARRASRARSRLAPPRPPSAAHRASAPVVPAGTARRPAPAATPPRKSMPPGWTRQAAPGRARARRAPARAGAAGVRPRRQARRRRGARRGRCSRGVRGSSGALRRLPPARSPWSRRGRFRTRGRGCSGRAWRDASIRAMSALPPLRVDSLPYVERLPDRPREAVDLVVIHCTELPDLATAREYGERVLYPDSGTGNSGHFYVDRDGSVHAWVPVERVGHHVRGYNPHSVGIELVNRGRYPHWLDSRHQAMDEAYTSAQIEALIELLQHLRSGLPSLRAIAGHE